MRSTYEAVQSMQLKFIELDTGASIVLVMYVEGLQLSATQLRNNMINGSVSYNALVAPDPRTNSFL